jgi:hypothetical protein
MITSFIERERDINFRQMGLMNGRGKLKLLSLSDWQKKLQRSSQMHTLVKTEFFPLSK